MQTYRPMHRIPKYFFFAHANNLCAYINMWYKYKVNVLLFKKKNPGIGIPVVQNVSLQCHTPVRTNDTNFKRELCSLDQETTLWRKRGWGHGYIDHLIHQWYLTMDIGAESGQDTHKAKKCFSQKSWSYLSICFAS